MPPVQTRHTAQPEGDHHEDAPSERGSVRSGRSKGSHRSHSKCSDMSMGENQRRSQVSRDSRIMAGGHEKQRALGSLVTMTQGGARNVMQKSGWYESPIAVSIRAIIRSKFGRLFVMVLLVVALVLPDIFNMAEVSTNDELDILLTGVMVVFVCEFFLLSLTDASYLFCFFFWMDLLGTLSLTFNISYMLGEDATEIEHSDDADAADSTNIVMLRAARSAKFGARAGRMARVMKLLQFLPFKQSFGKYDHTAKVIGIQLGNVISTRVAFIALCMVVLMPLFSIPRLDESMESWTKIIDLTVADGYATGHFSNEVQENVLRELQRFADFYKGLWYGPYKVCMRGTSPDSGFLCGDEAEISLNFNTPFDKPGRPSHGFIVTEGNVQSFFDLATPLRYEALGNMGITITVVTMMIVFCMVVNSNIAMMLLPPLDRMLSAVRTCCQSVFNLSSGDNFGSGGQASSSISVGEYQSEDFDDAGQTNEFELLELAVMKITAIAGLSVDKPKEKGEMDERDMILLNFTQGWRRHSSGDETRMGPMRSRSRAGLAQEWRPLFNDFPEEVVQSVGSPVFDACRLSMDHQVALAGYIVLTAEGSNNWTRKNVPREVLAKFLTACEATYIANPFHNFAHGLDVMHMLACFLTATAADRFLPDCTQFWLLIAAIAHDSGHLGVNNQYLISVSHELAMMYNDQSPLENMHCAKLFEILRDPGSNLFREVDKNVYKEMRMGVIDAILNTDMTKHHAMLKDASVFYQMNSGDETDWPAKMVALLEDSPQNKQLIVNVLLHTADVHNPTKPWELCRRQALLCLEEFFSQGDLEKAAGIRVEMLNDREKVNIPHSQIGFIEFVIAPLVFNVITLFPALDGMSDRLGQNLQRWFDMWRDQEQPAVDVLAKVQERVSKVTARCKSTMRGNEKKEELNLKYDLEASL